MSFKIQIQTQFQPTNENETTDGSVKSELTEKIASRLSNTKIGPSSSTTEIARLRRSLLDDCAAFVKRIVKEKQDESEKLEAAVRTASSRKRSRSASEPKNKTSSSTASGTRRSSINSTNVKALVEKIVLFLSAFLFPFPLFLKIYWKSKWVINLT